MTVDEHQHPSTTINSINNINILQDPSTTIGKRPSGRQPIWKTTPLYDNPLWNLWKPTSTPSTTSTSMLLEVTIGKRPFGRQHQQHRPVSNSGLHEQACLLMDAQL
jgi:hypothetical protein